MAGRTVLITADRRSDDLADGFARRGATIHHAPAMTIVHHSDDEQLVDDTRALIADPPDTLVITTGAGLRGWMEAAEVAGLDEDLRLALAEAHVVARGPKAKGALISRGLRADWVAESETAPRSSSTCSSAASPARPWRSSTTAAAPTASTTPWHEPGRGSLPSSSTAGVPRRTPLR